MTMRGLNIVFIDLEKAYDKVPKMFTGCTAYFRAINNMYDGAKTWAMIMKGDS